jgi:cyclase
MRITALLLCALISAAQAQDIEFKSTEVAKGVYLLDAVEGFGGGNVALLTGDEYIVLVDDAMGPTVAALIEAASAVAGRPVDFVINTHVHGDHVGGNQYVAENGALIVAHDNIRKRMKGDPDLDTGPGALPVITFSDAVTFHVNGQAAHVFHVENAHTDGDGALLLKDRNVIIAGDVFFHKLFPFIDIDNGGTLDGFIAGQQLLLSMADDATKIVPGHGSLAGKADLAEDLAMLVDAKERVKALIDKGMDAEAIVAANPLADYHDQYNWGFITTERMTRTLIRSLTTD